MGEAAARTASPRLPRAVWWFGATSFTNDFASEIVYPLLPAFVTRTLGGGALALGLLDGLADATAAGFKLLSGYLAERPRLRGPLVVGGYALAAIVRPLVAMAGAVWHVVALRAADRLGKGARTAPRDVMIAEAVPAELRGRAFGLHRGADHAGAVLGPLAATALLAAGFSVREVFWVAAIPGALAVLLAWMAVRAVGSRDLEVGSELGAAGTSDFRLRTSDGSLAALLAAVALAAFLRAPETLLILRAQDLGVPLAAVPVLWAGLHVVRSAASYPGGALSDRWGPRRTLATGWLAYAALAWAFAAAHTGAQALAVFLAFGIVAALTESPERALVAAAMGGARRGRAFGWYHGALGAVALPGAALFGWIYQSAGAETAFLLSAGLTLAAIAMLGLVSYLGRTGG